MSNNHGKVFYLTLSLTWLQGYQDGRDRMIHRSTSQGSINSPVYSRHSYTPTTSRSPQHFHRPGKATLPKICSILDVYLCEFSYILNVYLWGFFFIPLVAYKKPDLNISDPQRPKWKLVSIFILCCVLDKSVILSVCSLWIIKLHFGIALLGAKDLWRIDEKSSLQNLKISERKHFAFSFYLHHKVQY